MLAILFHHAHFFFFLVIALYFLILAAIAQTFNSIGETVNPIGIKITESKIETEIYPVIVYPVILHFEICSTQKLSRYILSLPFTHKAIQLVSIYLN